MKRLSVPLLSAGLLLLAFPTVAQENDDMPIRMKKFGDRIVLVKTGNTSAMPNVSAVYTKKGLIVFDTHSYPGIAEKIRKTIEREFGRTDIPYVVLTHGATDHTSGNEIFSDAVIIGHDNIPAEMNQFEAIKNDPNFRTRIDGLMESLKTNLEQHKEDSPEAKEIRETLLYFDKTLNSKLKVTPPVITFSERMTLRADDLTLIIVHNVPSYSDSDTIIYIPELRLLNVGDIFNKGRLPVIGIKSDIPRWLEIFKEFLDKESEIDVVIGGHGDPLTMADVRAQLDYVKDLYEGIQKAYKEGLSQEEIKRKFSFENFNHLTDYRPTVFPGMPEPNLHNSNVDAIYKIVSKMKHIDRLA